MGEDKVADANGDGDDTACVAPYLTRSHRPPPSERSRFLSDAPVLPAALIFFRSHQTRFKRQGQCVAIEINTDEHPFVHPIAIDQTPVTQTMTPPLYSS